jgi:opacity protein-like surface antigen
MRLNMFAPVLMATALGLSLVNAPHAFAAESIDWAGTYVDVSVGAASGQSHGVAVYDPQNLKPTGAVLHITAGDTFVIGDRFTASVELGATFGNVQASGKRQSCTVPMCGYVEDETETRSSTGDFSVGAMVGDTLGPVHIAVGGGVIASNYRQAFAYDSHNVYPSFSYEQNGYRGGFYGQAQASYAFGDHWQATLTYRYSDQTELRYNSSSGGSDSHYVQHSVLFGVGRRF